MVVGLVDLNNEHRPLVLTLQYNGNSRQSKPHVPKYIKGIIELIYVARGECKIFTFDSIFCKHMAM
jgi:hypothetical protein